MTNFIIKLGLGLAFVCFISVATVSAQSNDKKEDQSKEQVKTNSDERQEIFGKEKQVEVEKTATQSPRTSQKGEKKKDKTKHAKAKHAKKKLSKKKAGQSSSDMSRPTRAGDESKLRDKQREELHKKASDRVDPTDETPLKKTKEESNKPVKK